MTAGAPYDLGDVGTSGPSGAGGDEEGVRLDRALGAGFEAGASEDAEAPGSVLGRYVLKGRLGEGGFGTVFRAVQTEPVEREVALKVIRKGMDTRQLVARFRAEQQALARMEHPGIARVFDAGTTAGGRPYFVMELVEGPAVTRYCDERRLDTPARIEIFLSICHAVQHAHGKGLIHRDIKPSNVLVASVDGRPAPKVIDFGIAKAMGGSALDRSVLTEVHQVIGTPAYMSPEQADPGELDIDTRADVYSLGVLLYELLTGARPFEREMSAANGYHEVLRIIREVEPRRPSLDYESSSRRSAESAAQRGSTPHRLARTLRGELDAIVLVAMSKERERRYETVDAFAADLRRFLAHEPVAARAPSRAYLLRKFARRHRVGMTAACLALSSLVAGLAASWISFRESERARAAQAREHERALGALRGERAITDFLSDLLGSTRPERARGADLRVRDVLDEAAAGIGTAFPDRPAVEVRLRRILGTTYERLALYPQALEHLEQAVQLARGLEGEDTVLLGASLATLAAVRADAGDLERAVEHNREALAHLRQRPDDLWLGYVLANLSTELTSLGRDDEAEALALEGIAVGERVRVSVPSGCVLPRVYGVLARIRERNGRFAEAEQFLRKAVLLETQLRGSDDARVAKELRELVLLLLRLGRLDEAEAELERIAAIHAGVYGKQPQSRIEENMAQADLMSERGEYEAALEVLVDSLGLARRTHEQGHFLEAMILNNLAGVLWKLDRLAAAEGALQASIEMHLARGGEENPNVASGRVNLAVLQWSAAKYADAKATALQALDLQSRRHALDDPELIPIYGVLAGAHEGLGEHESAEELHQRMIEIAGALPEDHVRRFTTRAGYGRFLLGRGRLEEAESELAFAADGLRALVGERNPRTVEVARDLADLYERWNRPEEATAWRALATPAED